MTLPFDTQQFLAVFVAFNAAIWPAQPIAYGFALVAIGALLTRHPWRERIILAILSLFWAWNGIVYQLVYFSPINPAAVGFAALFVVQASLLMWYAIWPGNLLLEIDRSWRSALGALLTVYAAVIYEVLGVIAGHGLMKGPLLGVAPCPTTIFTVGMLLMMRGRPVIRLSVIPVVWALIGSVAAVQLGVPEDFGLTVAGLVLVFALMPRGGPVSGEDRRLA